VAGHAFRSFSSSSPSFTKANIKLVAELRKRTEVSLSKAKEALTATNNDVEAALEWLEKDLIASGAKKKEKVQDRTAGEGLIGVSVFFLLSGFLITQSSVSRIRYTGPHFTNYLVDRFARIFSVYIPVLLIIAVLNGMFNLGRWGQDGTSTGPVALLGNMLLLQDYPLFQAIRHVAGGALYIRPYNTAEPFWTVSIEFWIYVVFGVGFFGLLSREKLGRMVVPTL